MFPDRKNKDTIYKTCNENRGTYFDIFVAVNCLECVNLSQPCLIPERKIPTIAFN